jgi:hypothetical protein
MCAVLAAGLPDAATYRDVCIALRQEHDREVAISQQLQVRLPPGWSITGLLASLSVAIAMCHLVIHLYMPEVQLLVAVCGLCLL